MAILTSFLQNLFPLPDSILLLDELLELLFLCDNLDCDILFLISQLDQNDLLRSVLEQKLFCEFMRQCSCLFSFEISLSLFLRMLNLVFRQFYFLMKRQSSFMFATRAQVLFIEEFVWETFLRVGRMGWVWLVGLGAKDCDWRRVEGLEVARLRPSQTNIGFFGFPFIQVLIINEQSIKLKRFSKIEQIYGLGENNKKLSIFLILLYFHLL